MKKRLLAAALAVVMLLCLVPAALAAPDTLWEKQFSVTIIPYKNLGGSWCPCRSVTRAFAVECRADSDAHFYPADPSLVFEGEELFLRIAGTPDAALYGKTSEGGWKLTSEPDADAAALADGTRLLPGASYYVWVCTAYADEGRSWCLSGFLALSEGTPLVTATEPVSVNRTMSKLVLKDALDPSVHDRDVIELWRTDFTAAGRCDGSDDLLPFDFSLAAYGAWKDCHNLPDGKYCAGETIRLFAGAKYGSSAQRGYWKIVPGTNPDLPAVANGSALTEGVSYYIFRHNGSAWTPVYDLAIPGADELLYIYAGERIMPFTIQGIFALREPLDPAELAVTPPEVTPADLSVFMDLDPDGWYAEGIGFCLTNGLMNGCSDTEFAPDDPLSRAMILTVLWRLDGEKRTDNALFFEDIPESEWFTEAVRWACAEKIAVNSEGEYFGPHENVTREEIAAIFRNYAQYTGFDTDKVTENVNTLSFDDIFEVSPWANAGMHFCIAAGVLNGNDNGYLYPQGTATRAESACMIYRFLTNILEK